MHGSSRCWSRSFCSGAIARRDGVWELPHSSLRFVEQLGEGQFGEVHLCELQLGRLAQSVSIPVAVKVLSRPADNNAKYVSDPPTDADTHSKNNVISVLCCHQKQEFEAPVVPQRSKPLLKMEIKALSGDKSRNLIL